MAFRTSLVFLYTLYCILVWFAVDFQSAFISLKKTWRLTDGETNNEIDYVCISERWKTSIKDIMVCRGADVGSSYYLVRALMRLRLKKLKKTEKVQSFVIAKLKDPKSVEAYHLQLRNRFQVLQEVDMEGDVEDHWAGFKQTVPNTAEVTIGRRRGSQREKWIQEQTWELIDEGKKTAGKDRTGERGDSSTVQQSMVG